MTSDQPLRLTLTKGELCANLEFSTPEQYAALMEQYQGLTHLFNEWQQPYALQKQTLLGLLQQSQLQQSQFQQQGPLPVHVQQEGVLGQQTLQLHHTQVQPQYLPQGELAKETPEQITMRMLAEYHQEQQQQRLILQQADQQQQATQQQIILQQREQALLQREQELQARLSALNAQTAIQSPEPSPALQTHSQAAPTVQLSQPGGTASAEEQAVGDQTQSEAAGEDEFDEETRSYPPPPKRYRPFLIKAGQILEKLAWLFVIFAIASTAFKVYDAYVTSQQPPVPSQSK